MGSEQEMISYLRNAVLRKQFSQEHRERRGEREREREREREGGGGRRMQSAAAKAKKDMAGATNLMNACSEHVSH